MKHLFLLLFLSLIVCPGFSQMYDSIFTIVEQYPSFPGGKEAENKFLSENLKYPEQALAEKKEGKVYLNFIVCTDGKLCDIHVARGADPLLDSAAVEAVRKMPPWEPGRQRGKPVLCRFTMPFTFKLPASEKEIFTVVEDQPLFPGGESARFAFIEKNIVYPEEAKKKKIQGIVFVTFVVEQDGSLSDIKILRGIGGGCDEEVIRIVKLMPKWNPGRQRGKPVRVQFNVPFKFIL